MKMSKLSVTDSDVLSGRIMIVDDDPENLHVLEETLAASGYDIAIFPDGALALAAARNMPPDLILLDVRMPGLNGYEVCRRLKSSEDPRLRTAPVIFISAMAENADIMEGFAAGGVDYITKPFRDTEVLARTKTHIALRQAYLELNEQFVRLQELEVLRDNLVHMMAHDMRTPLQQIIWRLETLEENIETLERQHVLDQVQRTGRSLLALERMLSGMIDMSRLEARQMPVNYCESDIASLIGQVVEVLTGEAAPERITTAITLNGARPFCDPELTRRVLTNLLSNALKYSPANSKIEIGVRPGRGEREVFVWIRDQGPGIPPDEQRRIFDKYAVAQGVKCNYAASAGLGLAFCKLAVEAQAGEIGVYCPPGQGSTFWFTLKTVIDT